MSSLSREETIKVIVETLAPLKPQRIALFGSFARGDATASSDIDILVRLPAKRGTIGLLWFGLNDDLDKALGRKVDLVSESALSKRLKPMIEKDLVVIYEKAG